MLNSDGGSNCVSSTSKKLRVFFVGNLQAVAVQGFRGENIRIEAKAIVPADLQVSEVDLSLIIGNLLDNAMEACMKMKEEEEKFIRVYIDILKGQLYIYVMNSVGEDPKRVGRIYLTTKDKKFHGLGLIRMDQVVQKYHGYLDRQNEDGVFATEVMLPL